MPAAQSERYAEKVAAAGAGSNLVSRTVSRYGHCAFEQAELFEVFSSVVGRAAAVTRID